MIVRQCLRQSRQLRALNCQSRVWARFSSTETIVDTPAQQPNVVTATPIEEPTPSRRQAGGEFEIEKVTWNKGLAQKADFRRLGTTLHAFYNPAKLIQDPYHSSDITLELLLANQTHLGHSTSRWNPQNSRYIFGIRDGIHIISLDVTAAYLRRAAKVVEEVAARGGLILFAGTRKGQKQMVVRAAELAGGYHLFERWIAGGLTNGKVILGRGETKVVNLLDEELHEFRDVAASRPALKPDLVVCLNPLENTVLLHECGLNNVPTIGVIDTDADPTRVTYPIPANDDSLRAVSLIAGILGRAGEDGQRRRAELAKQGKTLYKRLQAKDLGLRSLRTEAKDEENVSAEEQ
ncbi:mitochondrial 37S ribosomal protein uS2m [Aspergillus saccharolyticus JOP 1030-1]|uniref:Ribosomal protein S2 n=1 Tax=Aspergillus saccharolyticus JOP 1030-1 TaxID=1450539 RepID=A0A318ZHB3_9EURO|nr:ribosomal protein S2 [Aspergillus saccharolyticus JOP 1030-1]PYH46147.1 ribosomal protein S2 [Aspergillus saccharolyticus JOP 1030-1]